MLPIIPTLYINLLGEKGNVGFIKKENFMSEEGFQISASGVKNLGSVKETVSKVKTKLAFLKEDGTIKGAWIATILTFLTILFFFGLGAITILSGKIPSGITPIIDGYLKFYEVSLIVYFGGKAVEKVANGFGNNKNVE
jgi:hypothetical protein